MTLIAAWRNSLNLLMPKNIKMFFLVFLRTVRDTYILLWEQAYKLLVLVGIFAAVSAIVVYGPSSSIEFMNQQGSIYSVHVPYVIGISFFLCFSLLILIFTFYTYIFARASLHKKDAVYVAEWKRDVLIPFIGARAFIALCMMPIYFCLALTFLYHQQILLIVATFLGQVGYIYFLFFLDLFYRFKNSYKNKFKAWIVTALYSLRNAGLFALYNMPIIVIFSLLHVLIRMISIEILPIPVVSFFVFFDPVAISLYAVLYTKFSYEHVSLYIEGSKR